MIYRPYTSISIERSCAEIKKTLQRIGADQFIYSRQGNFEVIEFHARGWQVKFCLPLPSRADFIYTAAKHRRRRMQVVSSWEQACKIAWREFVLIFKAKIRAIENGVTEFEDEFLAQIELPSGHQVGQWIRPQIAVAYERGDMPPLLPAPKS
jgi:hypothetical protein